MSWGGRVAVHPPVYRTCWSWISNTLAAWCEELTHLKRPWCWERLKAGGERDDRGWDGWVASPTQWTWVWVNSGSWWWTGKPGVLRFTGSQRVRHDWGSELNWVTSKSIHVAANAKIHSFCAWVIFHCMYIHHICIHSSVDRCLGCFHILRISRTTTVTIAVHVCFWLVVFGHQFERSYFLLPSETWSVPTWQVF